LRRPPVSLYFVTIIGLMLSILQIWEGLYIQLFTGFRNPEAPWLLFIEKLDLDPLKLGWPWIVLGISWISALCGVWLRLPWGRWALWIVCFLSLTYVKLGTILAALALIGLALPISRRWMKGGHVPV
jgi:hypothetical protein